MSQNDIEKLYALIYDMEKRLNLSWEKAIQQTGGVASDVKDLKVCFKQHTEEDRLFKEEIRPLLEGKRFIVYLRDIFKFFGLPLSALGAVFYWIWYK